MGFWLFMLAANLTIPFMMIGFGHSFIKHPPGDINWAYGYRTSMSMKNKDTWDFAHRHIGRLWRTVGAALLLPSIGAMLFAVSWEIGDIGLYGGIVCAVQGLCMTVPIFFTERALRKRFDKEGRRKPGF